MTLLSAYEDFSERTLAAIESVWEKLAYLRSLREDGRYMHWGLQRTHSEEAAQSAIARAHGETVLAVLRRPIRSVGFDLKDSDWETVGRIRKDAAAFSPEEQGGPMAAHLSSVAAALEELRRHRPSATVQAA